MGNRGLTAVAVLMVLLVPVTWYFIRVWWMWVIVTATAAAVIVFTKARATVHSNGVRVSLGPFGWPRKEIEVGRIVRANVEHIEPMSWGGWGWRIKPPATTVILRKGEALMLDLVDGKKFGVTVDEAATAAGLVNGLVARRQKTG